MPAPLLLARKSGLYCRIYVPTDLRPLLGQRYLVRALSARDRDEARLIAAQYAWVIGELFRELRRELLMPEPKVHDVLKALQSGKARELITVTETERANGDKVRQITIENDEDARIVKKRFGLSLAAASTNILPQTPYRHLPEHAAALSSRVPAFEIALMDEQRSNEYIKEFKRYVEIFVDLVGDLAPDDYTPTMIDHYVKRLKFLPPNPEKSKKYRDRWKTYSYSQMSHEVELMDMRALHPTTVKKHITRLHTFFKFCAQRRYMHGTSPLEGRAPKRPSKTKGSAKVVGPDGISQVITSKRMAYSMDDLNRIFDPVLYQSRKLPHTFWPPLIALMTGARVNEIAQLYLADIVDDNPDHPGQWRIMIIGKEIDQRVKNEPSIRSIPLHPKLIEMGFLVYLEDVKRLGYKRVFPTLRYTEAAGYGDTVSDYYLGYLRKKVGIIDANKVFHSFRYYFCSQLFNKSNKERMHIVGMTGHARDGIFEQTYCGELNYEAKLKILMKLELPDLKIPAYIPTQFDTYFISTERNKLAAKRRDKENPAVEATAQGLSKAKAKKVDAQNKT